MDVRTRWLTGVGLAVVAVVVLAHAAGPVGLGSSGAPLAVTVATVTYALSATTFLLWRASPTAAAAGLLVVVAASAVVLRLGDPAGPVVGIFFVVAYAPLRLPDRIAALLALTAMSAFNVAQLATSPNPVVFVLVTDMGAAFFYLLGTLLVDAHRERERADQLLTQLQAARAAERRAVVLDERARLAREIHDVLAHTLSGLALQLEGARLLARADGASDRLLDTVDRAHALTRDGLQEAKRAVSALRGDVVPGTDQLTDLADLHRRANGGRCTLTITGDAIPLAPEAGHALYRTAQEALTNVRKHAPGADVDITLQWSDTAATLVIHDHGGPQPADHPTAPGYGLTGMAERAELLGGHLTAGPADDGFRIQLQLPLSEGATT